MPKALPSNIPPRGLTRDQAAMYLNLSPRLFDELVKQGLYPGPLPGGIYDRKAIDVAMDRLSGLLKPEQIDWAAVARERVPYVANDKPRR